MEILIGDSMTPPEMDNYQEDEDRRLLRAIYESSSTDILDSMNTPEFKDTYKILGSDIRDRNITDQKIFVDKYLDKMSGLYEYEFVPIPTYSDINGLESMFKFIEFVEYDCLTFLKYVWRYLDDILEVKIKKYVAENEKFIIDEITNQINLLTTLNENISEFLRTYNKEGLMEWFIDRSERLKYDIYAENLE